MRSGIVALLFAAASCSGTAHQTSIQPPPPPGTHAVLAGPLCADNRCKCRDASTDIGAPEAGKKRYEFKLGPSPHPLWLTVAGGSVLYKSAESAEACFYLDLPSGAQPVELRASNPDGVTAAFSVHEYGTETKSWYDTFSFSCGSPGVCSFDELDASKASSADMDRCGSTKVKGVSWDHGKAPDQSHPSELVVRATLDIYKFAPQKPHGDETCGKGDGRRHRDAAP